MLSQQILSGDLDKIAALKKLHLECLSFSQSLTRNQANLLHQAKTIAKFRRQEDELRGNCDLYRKCAPARRTESLALVKDGFSKLTQLSASFKDLPAPTDDYKGFETTLSKYDAVFLTLSGSYEEIRLSQKANHDSYTICLNVKSPNESNRERLLSVTEDCKKSYQECSKMVEEISNDFRNSNSKNNKPGLFKTNVDGVSKQQTNGTCLIL